MKNQKTKSPPKWADRLLEFYCNPKLLEQIQGDVHELYYWRLSEEGERKAKRAFWWDVIRFFRWRNIRRSTTQQQQFNTIGMLKNYFKIGWRNLLKQRASSFINIFGLSCAIGCCLVAYLFISSIWFRGDFHENKEEIYLVTHTSMITDYEQKFGATSVPLADKIRNEFSSVKETVRVGRGAVVLKAKGDTFSEIGQFVDPEFMQMFTYKVKYGSKEALKDPNQVIITEKTALKLFGSAYPVGESVQMKVKGELKTFSIGAVLDDLPINRMFRFGILISYHNIDKSTEHYALDQRWEEQAWVFVQIAKKDLSDAVKEDFDQLKETQNQAVPTKEYLGIQLLPFKNIMNETQSIIGGPGDFGSLAPQILLAILALFLLTLAVFNYINIAVLMATRRIKEIGVRKVIGGRRGQLIFQFLSENTILCFLAIVLGSIMASTLFIPWFNDIAGQNLRIDLLTNLNLWVFLGILLIFITVVSGSYPAFYISSFKAVAIFGGKQKLGGKSKFTKVLLTFQFVLSILTIVAGLAFVKTNKANVNRDWGYSPEDKMFVNIPSNEAYFTIRDKLAQQPEVLDMSGSMEHIGKELVNDEVEINGELHELKVIHAAPNYAEMMGLRLKQGRYFNPEAKSDQLSGIIVNQTFLDWFEVPFPTDQPMTIDSSDYSIIGVVEDYHYYPFAFTIVPTAIMAVPDSNYNFLSIKLAAGSEEKMSETVKAIWQESVENDLYEGQQQASVFEEFYVAMEGVSRILLFTATLAIILSAMGLFGLVSLNINARIKDFGIRKVMGANISQISRLVYQPIAIIWLLGALIGGGLSIFLVSKMLDMIYAYHAPVGYGPLVTAVVILLTVIGITIGFQLHKLKNSNPVDILRIE